MPTLLLRDGFKFFFYANEHEPKHVQAAKAEDYAKVELSTFRVVTNYMKPSDLKKVLQIIQENNEIFGAQWNDWFRQR